MNDIVTIDVKAVFEAAVAKLDDEYDFGYVEYDDQLSPEQVQQCFEGGLDAVSLKIQDSWADHTYGYWLPQVINDLIEDDTERAALLDHDDYAEQLREAIMQRDKGDPFRGLARNTGKMLLRYHLGNPNLDQDLEYMSGDRKGFNLERTARKFCRMAGLDYTVEKNAKAFQQMVLEQSYYGGQLYVFWLGNVDEFLRIAEDVASQEAGGPRAKRRTITWTNPEILLLDRYNGSGYSERVEGTVRKRLDLSRLDTDAKGGGYGWDSVAGLVHSAFRCDVTITPPVERTR